MKNIFAEIITIGDEILYGQITDTNSQWISTELDKLGIKVVRKSSVGDNEKDILEIFSEAESRADIILVTGGLGPTNDDITKNTFTKYFNSRLVVNENALKTVTHFFNSRNRELTEINRQQAYLPEVCEYIPNNSGTAPAMLFRKNNKVFISMPGVPFEMKFIMTEEVIPRLKKEFNPPVIFHKIIKTVGLGESYLAEKIKDWEAGLPAYIKLAYLPSFSEVKLRLTGFGDNKELLEKEINFYIESLSHIIPEYIFGYNEDTLEKIVGELLLSKNYTLGIAESCTGGFLSHAISSVPGCSAYFKGSIIAYNNNVKIGLLDVERSVLEENGAVSEETIVAMAQNICIKMNTSVGIATSGIAGPGGGTKDKPVGTIWIACSDTNRTITRKLTLGSIRDVNIRLTTISVLNMLRLFLLQSQY